MIALVAVTVYSIDSYYAYKIFQQESLYFEDTEIKSVLNKTLSTLERRLPDFDIGYWSMYEDGMRICSPFYHKLHIAQLNVMYELTGSDVYKKYADKFEVYQNNGINRKRAFVKKAMQKLFKE